MNMTALVGRTLQWTQPRLFHENYRLQDGDEVLGTLDFRSMWGTLATAKLAGGCWSFKRLGFLQTRVSVRRYLTDGFVRMSGQMEILAPAAGHPDVPIMMMLGWYLAVMMYRDAAASA